MRKKALRDQAFKEAILRLRRYKEQRKRRDFLVAPFVLQSFLAGVDYTLSLIPAEKLDAD